MQEEQYADLYWDRDPAEHEKFVAQLAPIVLFTYNRLKHTKQTVEALQANVYAADSELYIYSDAPKNEKAAESVTEVREYIHSITGFKKITIIERVENWGLARNIIDGVTKIVNEYGKIIVLEDDIVTSKWFLKYMNDALKVYEDKPEVIEINGYTLPVEDNPEEKLFFLKIGGCWGWATWADRWKYFEREPEKIKQSFTEDDVYEFNFSNTEPGNFAQIEYNCTGRLYTWAIFWDYVVFRRGVSLNSSISLSKNCGFDASGEHCSSTNHYDVNVAQNPVKCFPLKVKENAFYRGKHEEYYKKINYIPAWKKLARTVKSVLFSKK